MRVQSWYLKQLSVGQRLTQQLLCVATDNKQCSHDGHQHPGEDERKAHPPDKRRQDGDMTQWKPSAKPFADSMSMCVLQIKLSQQPSLLYQTFQTLTCLSKSEGGSCIACKLTLGYYGSSVLNNSCTSDTANPIGFCTVTQNVH